MEARAAGAAGAMAAQAPGDSRHAAVSVASQNVLRKYGYNGEPAHLGAVQPEVRAALHQHARLEKKLRRSVWALVAMGVALLLTLACVFGVSVAAAVLVKETRVQGNTLVSKSSEAPVSTGRATEVSSLGLGYDYRKLAGADSLSLEDAAGNHFRFQVASTMVEAGGQTIRLHLSDGSTAEADRTALTVLSPEGRLVAGVAFVDVEEELNQASQGRRSLKFGKVVSTYNSVKSFFTKKGEPQDSVKTYVEDKGAWETAAEVHKAKEEVKEVVENLVDGIDFGVCGLMGATGRKLVGDNTELRLRTMLAAAMGKSKDDVNLSFYYAADASGGLLYNRMSHYFPLDSSADSDACQAEYCVGVGSTVGPGAGALIGAVAMEDPATEGTCSFTITLGLPGGLAGVGLAADFDMNGKFLGVGAEIITGLEADIGSSVTYTSCAQSSGVMSSMFTTSLYEDAFQQSEGCLFPLKKALEPFAPACGESLNGDCLDAIKDAAKEINIHSDGKVATGSRAAEALRQVIMPQSIKKVTALDKFELSAEGNQMSRGCRLSRTYGRTSAEECAQRCEDAGANCQGFAYSPVFRNHCDLFKTVDAGTCGFYGTRYYRMYEREE